MNELEVALDSIEYEDEPDVASMGLLGQLYEREPSLVVSIMAMGELKSIGVLATCCKKLAELSMEAALNVSHLAWVPVASKQVRALLRTPPSFSDDEAVPPSWDGSLSSSLAAARLAAAREVSRRLVDPQLDEIREKLSTVRRLRELRRNHALVVQHGGTHELMPGIPDNETLERMEGLCKGLIARMQPKNVGPAANLQLVKRVDPATMLPPHADALEFEGSGGILCVGVRMRLDALHTALMVGRRYYKEKEELRRLGKSWVQSLGEPPYDGFDGYTELHDAADLDNTDLLLGGTENDDAGARRPPGVKAWNGPFLMGSADPAQNHAFKAVKASLGVPPILSDMLRIVYSGLGTMAGKEVVLGVMLPHDTTWHEAGIDGRAFDVAHYPGGNGRPFTESASFGIERVSDAFVAELLGFKSTGTNPMDYGGGEMEHMTTRFEYPHGFWHLVAGGQEVATTLLSAFFEHVPSARPSGYLGEKVQWHIVLQGDE